MSLSEFVVGAGLANKSTASMKNLPLKPALSGTVGAGLANKSTASMKNLPLKPALTKDSDQQPTTNNIYSSCVLYKK
ncbi:hypothetical protein [Chroococcidiopsis sp.]|uniref:hypothetical protein n=1 Tax=Chroococcidiopsis sp. TaxID=3088168 RepID=UPI003F303FF5